MDPKIGPQVYLGPLKNICSALRGVIKKNGKKAGRLTAWVDPPPPSPEAVRKM